MALAVQAQQKATASQVKKWVKEDSALSLRIRALQARAQGEDGNLYREDTVLRNAQYEMRLAEMRKIQHKDSTKIPGLQQKIAALTLHKAATQQRFDRLLILIDSTMGVRNEVERRIKAKQ